MGFYDSVNEAIKLAVEENNAQVQLMPVGKLRKFDRVLKNNPKLFKEDTKYRVNAVKDVNGVWRQWPNGQEIDLSNFPLWDPGQF